MTERTPPAPRRIAMRRMILPVALGLLVLAGCGDEDAEPTGTPTKEASSSLRVCQAVAPASIKADLDGDGAAETLEFTQKSGECPATARVGDDSVQIDGDNPITAKDLRVVRVPGHRGDLVLYTFTHPRGGFEARLFTAVGGKPQEVTHFDGPLVPFVATDAATAYATIRCTADGFEVITAEAHQPAGVMAAWDVYRVAYTGTPPAPGAPVELADNVTEEKLPQQFPGLVANKLFAGCA